MKILFTVLVALNAIYFAWHISHDGKPAVDNASPRPAQGQAPSLLLLSEREPMPVTLPARGGRMADAAVAAREAGAQAAPEAGPKPASAPGQARTADEPAMACYRVGPFEDRRQAESLAATEPLQSVPTTIEEARERRRAGYWVKWAEELTLPAARGVMSELRGKGVSDMSISPQDNKRYVLSLGVFGTRYYMEQRVDEMRALGYEPIVEERHKEVSVYWLHTGQMDAGARDGLRALAGEMGGARIESVQC
ncbi:MAG TPA: hypothetical protein ENK29_04870 [Chromatiales bacterium]|nr:hypothetical protein [Chromatiales bacterium]